MKKYIWIAVVIIILLVVAVYTKKPEVYKKIKVGAVFSMTGFGQLYGEETQKGFDLCKNSNIELIVEDSQSKPTVGVTAFNKLVSVDKPDIILVMMSSVAESTLPLVKNYIGPVLATSVSASKITERGGEKYFRYFSTGETESKTAAEYMLNTLKVKKVGVLYLNSDYGLTYVNGITEVFGKEFVVNESFNQGTTDFKTHIIKLKESGADAIYIAGYDNDLLLAIKDIRLLKYSGIVFANEIFTNITNKLDKEVLEGIYFSALRFFTAEKSDSFYTNFKQKYNTEATWYASMGCDIARQINGAKSSDLLSYYSNLKKFNGLNGEINSKGRELEIIPDIAVYKDGTIKILKVIK
jgi:branched-chain amino acid transport system substrate-binding protein